jgi:hypothetical protein
VAESKKSSSKEHTIGYLLSHPKALRAAISQDAAFANSVHADFSLLYVAVMLGLPDAVAVLLHSGAKVEFGSALGITPLQKAVNLKVLNDDDRYDAIIDLLVDAGADLWAVSCEDVVEGGITVANIPAIDSARRERTPEKYLEVWAQTHHQSGPSM